MLGIPRKHVKNVKKCKITVIVKNSKKAYI